jgi:hypothetical protein
MNDAGRFGAFGVLLAIAATVALAACGSSASTDAATVYASCMHKQSEPSSIEAHVHCQVEAQRSCPKGVLFYARVGGNTGRCGLPNSVRFEVRRVELKFVPAWISCVARNGYKLPTPNTSGTGPEFPIAIQRNSTYRAAAERCVSIERRESNALLLAERSWRERSTAERRALPHDRQREARRSRGTIDQPAAPLRSKGTLLLG